MEGAAFSEIFLNLKQPFVFGPHGLKDEVFEGMNQGSLIIPTKDGYLRILIFENGAILKTLERVEYPETKLLSSGFDESDFANGLSNLKDVLSGGVIKNYNIMEAEFQVMQNGQMWETSLDTSICSAGSRSVGYFDLVVMKTTFGEEERSESGIVHVNYQERIREGITHSGDQTSMNNLVHEVTFSGQNEANGVVVLVGYNNQSLKLWYGKSVGLFIIDKESNKSSFIPLDLSEITVGENTTIVPVMFRRTQRGTMRWYVPDTMSTGSGNTNSVHNDPKCPAKRLLMEFDRHFPEDMSFEEIPQERSPGSEGPPGTSDTVLPGVENLTISNDEAREEAQISHDGSACQVCMSEFSLALDGIHQKYYFLRSFGETPPGDSDKTDLKSGSYMPFLFPGESIQGRTVALYKYGYSRDQIYQALLGRPLIINVESGKGIDSMLMKSRRGNNGITRMNCVFIVHIDKVESISKANMSVVSFYAGPRATVVYKLPSQASSPARYLLNWATPRSVIPATMTNELHPEISDFEAKLGEYARSPAPPDSILPLGDARDFAITLPEPHGRVSFNTLERYLERTCELSVHERMSIMQHLFAFEYVLEDIDVKRVQEWLRKYYKSPLTSKQKMEFFKRVQESGATKKDREEIVHASKKMERMINLLACRKYLTVNEFFSAFQEKKAGHGQKAAAKMDLGLSCKQFVKQGDISPLIEKFDEFIIARMNVKQVSNFLTDFSGGKEVAKRVAGGYGHKAVDMASLDSRTPSLDGVTVDCMVTLTGIQHELLSEGSTPFAVPTMQRQTFSGEEYSGDGEYDSDGNYIAAEFPSEMGKYQSLVFLPVFPEMVADVTTFDVSCWAYSLVEGFRNCSLYPRDLVAKSRAVEYAVLIFLVSLIEKLCAQRSTEVTTEEDAKSDLVCRIRSVYWVIRAVMAMNVNTMTPEPVCSVLTAGTINHKVELELGLRILKCMRYTGLHEVYLKNHVQSLHSVLLRAMYRPFESIFLKLANQNKSKAHIEIAAVTNFYQKAKEVDASILSARIRPKICRICNCIKSKHDFPREKQFMLIKEKVTFRADLDKNICFECQGFDPASAPMMCARKSRCIHSDKPADDPEKGHCGPYTDFAASSAAATCHSCVDSCHEASQVKKRASDAQTQIEKPPSKKRRVPPQYFNLIGEQVPPGNERQRVSDDNKIKVKDLFLTEDTVLESNALLPLTSTSMSNVAPKSTLNPSDHKYQGYMSTGDLISYGRQLGMLSTPEYARATGSDIEKVNSDEIIGCYSVMLLKFMEAPAWKAAVPTIIAGGHKQTINLSNTFEIVYKGNNDDAMAIEDSAEKGEG